MHEIFCKNSKVALNIILKYKRNCELIFLGNCESDDKVWKMDAGNFAEI